MAAHNELGNQGESLAKDYLIQHGYQILETNYRFQKAEVDIISLKGETLAVIEVKTRSTDLFGNPQDFVNQKKIKLLTNAIDHYINERDLQVEVRFDIIAIIWKNNQAHVKHLEDAFLHF